MYLKHLRSRPGRQGAHVEGVVTEYGGHVGRSRLRGQEGCRVLAESERRGLTRHGDGHLTLTLTSEGSSLCHRAQRKSVRERQRIHATMKVNRL